MPNSAAAKKALRQSEKRRTVNRTDRSTLRTVIKKVRVAAAEDDKEATDAAFRLAVKKIDQAASKNLIHKNKAARSKSRLARLCKIAATTTEG